LSVGALGFLTFLAGALLMVSGTFPAGHIQDAYQAGGAVYERFFRYRDRFATDLWVTARSTDRGVTVCRPDAAHPGLTLYTSGDDAHALLVDLQGNQVYRWHRPFSTVWDDTSAVIRPVPDDHVYFRKAQMFPDGRLLALYEGVGDTPYGYGMAMLDPDSQIVWRNMDNLHHDFDLTPDQRVIALAHGFRHEPLEGADQFDPPLLEDFLVVLDAEGRTVSRISLLDALNRSAFRSFLWRIPYYSMADPLHANGVDYLDAAKARWLARRLPAAREGQVLVSFRELAGGSLALIDPESGEVAWASRGPWLAQHDPDILPGGTIQVFDNRGNVASDSKSRVIEVEPDSGGIVWSYADAPEGRPLDSPIRASQQRLPNGNTLITESSGGRLLEITRKGELVWEYVNPVRGGAEDALVPVVSWAQRVEPHALSQAFAKRLVQASSETASGRCTQTRDSE
jgi:hypothetical protein